MLFTAIAPSRPIIILNPAQALTIASIYDPEALSVIVSPNQPVGVVIALDAAQFVVASGPPSFRAGVDAILHMNDAPIDIASGPAPPTLANIAAPVKSMFQTNTVALRMIWEVNWLMRRSSSVAWLSGATW